MPVTPADHYLALLARLHEQPARRVLTWRRLLDLLRGESPLLVEELPSHLRPGASGGTLPGISLWVSGVLHAGTAPGARAVALRMAMAVAAEQIAATLQSSPMEPGPRQRIGLLAASEALAFTGPLVVPEVVDQLSDIHAQLAHVPDARIATLRQLAFMLRHGMQWLAFPSQQTSQRERLLYSLPNASSEKFWTLTRTRWGSKEAPAQWRMTHGRIHISQSTRDTWDQTEAFRRLQAKLEQGYWEAAGTGGPEVAGISLRNLTVELLLAVQRLVPAGYQTAIGPLWYALVTRALPVREGLSAPVVLGSQHTLPFQGADERKDAWEGDGPAFRDAIRDRLYGPGGAMGTAHATLWDQLARTMTPVQRKLLLDALEEAGSLARAGARRSSDAFVEAFQWVVDLDKMANLHLDRATRGLLEEFALRAFARGQGLVSPGTDSSGAPRGGR